MNERSATRAERLADLTELKVATASTRVPPAVASEERVTQSTPLAVGRRAKQSFLGVPARMPEPT
jgi:hypothetical protein